jgi:hypothetical protein
MGKEVCSTCLLAFGGYVGVGSIPLVSVDVCSLSFSLLYSHDEKTPSNTQNDI